ncbi:hypothetical protein Tco_1209750 [Tanacetum coccineum]
MSTEVHQAAESVTTSNELDLLFGPLFDEYFNGENQVVLKSSAVTTTDASNKRQQQPDSTSSTSTLATTVSMLMETSMLSYALSWKPCQGDSLNLPDHRINDSVAASFQQRAQLDHGSQIKMIQVKEMMQDNDLKNSKSKDKGSKSRSQSMNEQSRYKQDKTITRQSINVKRHIFNVIGDTEKHMTDTSSFLLNIKRIMVDLLYLEEVLKEEKLLEKQTVTARTLDSREVQITATIDGKVKHVSEASIRRHLKLEDLDGISTLPNTKIFEQLPLMGPKKTAWEQFSSNIATAIICLATNRTFNFSKMILEGMDILVVSFIFPIMLVQGLILHGERSTVLVESHHTPIDVRHGGAATTVSSLDAGQGSGNIPKSPTIPHDSPLSGGNTHGSDEGRPNINELMDICTQLSNRVLALKHSKTAQDLVIKKLQKKVKRLEKMKMARTPGMKLFKIGTYRKKTLDKENVSKQGRDDSNKTEELNQSDKASGETEVFNDTIAAEKDVNAVELVFTAGDAVNTASIIPDVSAAGPSTSTAGDIFEDEMTTFANTLVAIRSTRPKTTSVVIRDVEEEPRRATPIPTVQSQDKGKGKMVEPEPTSKNPIKAQIQMDVEIAQRLFEEEQS